MEFGGGGGGGGGASSDDLLEGLGGVTAADVCDGAKGPGCVLVAMLRQGGAEVDPQVGCGRRTCWKCKAWAKATRRSGAGRGRRVRNEPDNPPALTEKTPGDAGGEVGGSSSSGQASPPDDGDPFEGMDSVGGGELANHGARGLPGAPGAEAPGFTRHSVETSPRSNARNTPGDAGRDGSSARRPAAPAVSRAPAGSIAEACARVYGPDLGDWIDPDTLPPGALEPPQFSEVEELDIFEAMAEARRRGPPRGPAPTGGDHGDGPAPVGPSGLVPPPAGSSERRPWRGRRGWYFLRPRYWWFRAWRRAVSEAMERVAEEVQGKVSSSLKRRAIALRACGRRVLTRACGACGEGREASGVVDDGSGRIARGVTREELGGEVFGPKPCRCRSCSFCQRRASLERVRRLMEAVRSVPEVKGYAWRFLTVTVPYKTEDPAAVTVEALRERIGVAHGVLAEAWEHGTAMHSQRWKGMAPVEREAWAGAQDAPGLHRVWWAELPAERRARFVERAGGPKAWGRLRKGDQRALIRSWRLDGLAAAMKRGGGWRGVQPWVARTHRMGVEGAALFASAELGGKGGGHVHAHALYYGPRVDQSWLTDVSHTYGGGWTWVEAASTSTLREVAKYACKSPSPLDEAWIAGEHQRLCLHPLLVARWEAATFGVRLTRVRGELVGKLDPEEDYERAEAEEVAEARHTLARDEAEVCACCGRQGDWVWRVRGLEEWVRECHARGIRALHGSRWRPPGVAPVKPSVWSGSLAPS